MNDALVDDRKITVSLPQAVIKQLRTRVAEEDTTIRALILKALAQAGYDIPVSEIRDRRRRD